MAPGCFAGSGGGASRRGFDHGQGRRCGCDERASMARRHGQSRRQAAPGDAQLLLPSRSAAAAISKEIVTAGNTAIAQSRVAPTARARRSVERRIERGLRRTERIFEVKREYGITSV